MEAIETLNWRHGRGNVVQLNIVDRYFFRHIPTAQRTGFLEKRRFRISGRTVFALRHQVTGQ